jgi:hypothetical protein
MSHSTDQQALAWVRIHDLVCDLGWYDEYNDSGSSGPWIDWLLTKMTHLHMVNLLTEKKETEKAERNSKAWEVILRGNGDFNIQYKD